MADGGYDAAADESLDRGAPGRADSGDSAVVTPDGSAADSAQNHDSAIVAEDGSRPIDGRSGDVGSGIGPDAADSGRDAGLTGGLDAAVGPCANKQCPGSCASASRIFTLDGPANNTLNFNTLGSVCVIHLGDVVHGWSIANSDGRTVSVFAATNFGPFDPVLDGGSPGPIAAGPDGYVYWVVSPGSSVFTQLFYF